MLQQHAFLNMIISCTIITYFSFNSHTANVSNPNERKRYRFKYCKYFGDVDENARFSPQMADWNKNKQNAS